MAIDKTKYQRRILGLVYVFSFVSMTILIMLFFNIDGSNIIGLVGGGQVEYVDASTIYIPESKVNIWNDRYESEKTEFIYCLYGEVHKDGYLITEMKTTDVVVKEEDHLVYKMCDRNRKYLGNIHSHPYPGTCSLSKQDIYAFGSENQILTGIICGENKIAMYGIGNFEESYKIDILEGE